MEFNRLGRRNLTVAFQDPFYTTTHLIFGEHRVYVCDTFLGPESMEKIAKIIKDEGADDRPVVVFNSHADWDHIWGNCYFKDAMILGHEQCRERINQEGKAELELNGEHQQGEVILTPPTVVFEDNYIFEDDGVEFFHSPGHTIDSASCYDRREKVLFVGDNVESSIPYTNSLDIDTYITTLQNYLDRDWKYLVLGHDTVQTDDKVIRENMDYLRLLKDWKVDLETLTQKALDVHLYALSKFVDEIIETGVQQKAKAHYLDALSLLRRMEPTEKITGYLEQLRRVVE
ncbi:MAG: MBL fold metallo-hydrolase [Candidatus Thorarchaeota archaeon]|nr:MBL fold metallo-hydrolase [Candidatus Thorarchaeota archaeon]